MTTTPGGSVIEVFTCQLGRESLMHTSRKLIGLWSAVSMGIVAMVGAGIFALLGEASGVSGSAVYISFIVGGVIALFSGYSLG
jgi:amino acid transporter